MKDFQKRRTIALLVTSLLTTLCCLSASNYKNSLMSLDFSGDSDNGVKMTLQTRYEYDTPPLTKKDANTYVIILPEMDSNAPTPDLSKVSRDIQSVNVRTMPYSQAGNGYTKIVIKTTGINPLSANSKIYEPTSTTGNINKENTIDKDLEPITPYPQNVSNTQYNKTQEINNNLNKNLNNNPVPIQTTQQQFDQKTEKKKISDITTPKKVINNENNNITSNNNEATLLIFGIFVIFGICLLLFKKAKVQIAEIIGETTTFDDDDKKESNNKKIKSTINILNKKYKSPTLPVKKDIHKQIITKETNINEIKTTQQNIVDLDELFYSTKNEEVEENYSDNQNNNNIEDFDALDSFLDEFNFEEYVDNQNKDENKKEELFDEKLFNKIMQSNLRFSNQNLELMKNLLNIEVTDSSIETLKKLVSNPIEEKKNNEKQLLENLVTEYSISRNITFKRDDIKILRSLMSVELDKDFITNLRTDPERTKQMQMEIENFNKELKQSSEIKMLKVDIDLPNLADEIIKQNNKDYSYNKKNDTIDYSEGNDYITLNVSKDLPDLSYEINNEQQYEYVPSTEIKYADNSYEVDVLSLEEVLPTFETEYKEPEKVKETIMNEDEMLNALLGTSFKPFYEENVAIDNMTNPIDKILDNNIITNEDFQFTKEDDNEKIVVDTVKDIKEKDDVNNNSPNNNIQQQKVEFNQNTNKKEDTIPQNVVKCIIEGKTYTIINETSISEEVKCYLAKNNEGYSVLCSSNENMEIIKFYKNLKTELFQARKSNDLPNGTRHLIRVGQHKFVVDNIDNNLSYVMDLC